MKGFIIGFCLFFCGFVFAEDNAGNHVHGSHVECPLPKSALDVVVCSREQAPSAQRAELGRAQIKSRTEIASQLRNPELEIESVSGTIDSEKQSESKIAVLIPFELGSKRSARKLQAQSELKVADAELYDVQAEITIETILKLYRLRQLDQEKTILRESIDSFNKIINQQRSRPGLSAEQTTSLSVFRLALAEAKIRLSELFEEEKAIEHYFHIITGHSLKEIRPILPAPYIEWPQVRLSQPEGISPGLAKSRAELELALAEQASARSESWPEFKLGPMASVRREGSNSGSIYGFQLSMGLPVLSLNGGSREHARLGEVRASKSLELTKTEEAHERAEQVQIYERVVQVLKDSPSAEAIEKEHFQQESIARRGLVSAALIIESHRQMEELTRSRHGRELKAIESLWRIHKFDGLILEEKL